MPTTNPVPSQDPSDLLFNAGKLDEVLNGTGTSFTDRLGTARRTVAGMNADFDAQLADAESDLNVYRADAAASAAQSLGYLNTIRTTSYGAYASDPATDPLGNPPNVGDEYFNTTSNLLKRFNGTTWQASDINTANLAASSGSSLIGYDTGTVQDVLDGSKSLQDYAALRTYTGRAKRIYITGLPVTAKPAGIAGSFQHDPTDTTSLEDGGTIIVGADGRRWKRDYIGAINVKWFGAVGDGIHNDMDAFAAAINIVPASGAVIEAKNGKWRIDGIVYITKSNITIDGEGSVFFGTTVYEPLFWCIPQSLVTSRRYFGDDYPSSWRNPSTNATLPFEGDPNTMMYEHVAENRLKNIEFRNITLDPSVNLGLFTAYSVDGIRVTGCDIRPAKNSATRFFFCQDVSISENTLGGYGIYVAFFFKCRDVTVHDNDIKSHILRALSFKGCYHIDRPIWEAIPFETYGYVPMDIRIYDNKFSAEHTDPSGPYANTNSVSIGFDNPGPTILTDPVALQGGNPIGFTTLDWRGSGIGYFVFDNEFDNKSIPSNRNQALDVGYPSANVVFTNNKLNNSIIVAVGIKKLNVSDNEFKANITTGPYISISRYTTSGLNIYPTSVSCSLNELHDPVGFAGVETPVIDIRAQGLEVFGNKIWNPKSNISHGVFLNPGTKNAQIYGNKLFATADSSPDVTILNAISSYANNILGAGNWVINENTGVSSEVSIGDHDIGKFLRAAQLGDLAFMNKTQFAISPPATATPYSNGDMTFQLTSDTSIAIRVRGSDGVVRSGSITLS